MSIAVIARFSAAYASLAKLVLVSSRGTSRPGLGRGLASGIGYGIWYTRAPQSAFTTRSRGGPSYIGRPSSVLVIRISLPDEQPQLSYGRRDREDKRDRRHSDGGRAGPRSTCRRSRCRLCATLRPASHPSSKTRLCRR